jgi:glycosyltransferase involved in cell wall biosynthesis
MSLISVIIPAKNAEATLGATLDSVAGQAGVQVETIVVDDGSTDRTREIAAGHAAAPRIVVGPGAGAAAARNAGFAASTGQTIVFLDGDDLLKPGALQRRLRVLGEEGPNTIVVTDHVELVEGRERPSRTRPDFGGDPREALLHSNRLTVHAALVPRDLLDRVPGPFIESLVVYEDWALWLHLALLGAHFRVLDIADCVYRIRSAGMVTDMTTDLPRAQGDAIRVLGLAKDWIKQTPRGDRRRLDVIRRRRLREYLWSRARDSARRGKLIRASVDALRVPLVGPGDLPRSLWRRGRRRLRAVATRMRARS